MMIEDSNTKSETPSQDSAIASKPVTSKTRTRKSKAAKEALPSTDTAEKGTRKKYSLAERAKLLASISKDLKSGDTTVKTALTKVGISEQTYYNWKKASEAKVQIEPIQQSDELKALVELEAENQRLRKALAQKLRTENAELRKRLGL
ncbi:transposase [Brucella sp. HL-2]|nr:transposase [Brucella sp. HL-2]MCV9907604.1 transposase [Brucella sp. HL-2]